MRHLTDDIWAGFVRADGTFDGRRFESMVERLLNCHFGAGWRITGMSWDGGRDAVRSEGVGASGKGLAESWAECKLHRRPVSLKLLSGTLVMAVMEQPRRLIFFSYSPIILNAQEHLARFSMATSIPIEIVDDEILEDLILSSRAVVRPFFSVLPETPGPANTALEFVPRFTRDFDIDPSRWSEAASGEPEAIATTLSLRAILRLQLFIRNSRFEHSRPVRIELRGADAPAEPFELLNPDDRIRTLSIGAAGIALHELYVRSIEAGGHIVLPHFVTTDLSEGTIHEVHLGSVTVRPLFQPPLIGGRFRDAIETFREAVSLRSRPVFASVCGASGTGKTRLKAELVAVLLAQGFEIHSFDGSSAFWGGFGQFVRRLLAAVNIRPQFS